MDSYKWPARQNPSSYQEGYNAHWLFLELYVGIITNVELNLKDLHLSSDMKLGGFIHWTPRAQRRMHSSWSSMPQPATEHFGLLIIVPNHMVANPLIDPFTRMTKPKSVKWFQLLILCTKLWSLIISTKDIQQCFWYSWSFCTRWFPMLCRGRNRKLPCDHSIQRSSKAIEPRECDIAISSNQLLRDRCWLCHNSFFYFLFVMKFETFFCFDVNFVNTLTVFWPKKSVLTRSQSWSKDIKCNFGKIKTNSSI